MGVLIHASPAIEWHLPFANKMLSGLKVLGISAAINGSRTRESDISILLGTTLWRNIEAQGRYLLVDRCSFNNTNEWVSLVWDGHGRRGDHKTPNNVTPERWNRVGCDVRPWVRTGARITLCGQTETYSPSYPDMWSWYSQVGATHFRPHPAGDNPTGLPVSRSWENTARVITLNSSVGVESVMAGIPTVTMDGAAMAWDVTSHDPNKSITPDRTDWLAWLAWTQWHHDEIEAGEPIRHLFEDI